MRGYASKTFQIKEQKSFWRNLQTEKNRRHPPANGLLRLKKGWWNAADKNRFCWEQKISQTRRKKKQNKAPDTRILPFADKKRSIPSKKSFTCLPAQTGGSGRRFSCGLWGGFSYLQKNWKNLIKISQKQCQSSIKVCHQKQQTVYKDYPLRFLGFEIPVVQQKQKC